MSLVSLWWSSFRITFSAVYGSASVGLERNFAFLSTVGANCLVHLFLIHLLFNSYSVECKKLCILARLS